MGDESRYPPIGDYALIGDCHSAALVSRQASIDWCCMPRFDSASVFGRLLDWDRGGFCSVDPMVEECRVTRAYLDDTLVLVTTFAAPAGEARLIDCFTTHEGGKSDPWHQLLRVVEGERGAISFRIRMAARFDYGEIGPWLRHHGRRLFSAVGGNDALVVSGDVDLEPVDLHTLEGTVNVRAGQRVRISLVSVKPEEIDPDPPRQADSLELDRRLDTTVAWWRQWSAQTALEGFTAPDARRSALVLKALTNAPTGAVAAAPTTSLPESMGGERNWDYRFSWIRDSHFTVRSLAELGFVAEADGFRRFIERTAAGSPRALQIMYGLGGERRLTEVELSLEGYRGSRPVRVGNAASNQLQLDMYGELLDLAWRWHQRGRSPDDDYWRFLMALVDTVVDLWPEPDRGIWEIRGEPRHFVHSKAMCWVAVDRGLRLAEECLRRAPEERWRQARDEIRAAIESEGYEEQRGVFVRAFGSQDLDASLLLLPAFGFISYQDERMVRTTDSVWRELNQGGLLVRYRAEDGLRGQEGAFVACTFWLAECLARQGRVSQARDVYDRGVSTSNDLGLYSEEYDPEAHELLGNFPQGLTHLSQIAAAVALTEVEQGSLPP